MKINPVIIFGAGGLGLMALDIFQAHGIVVYGFLDDDAELHGSLVQEVPVLGSTDDQKYLKLIGQKCDAFVAIDDTRERRTLVQMLKEVRHVMPVNAIHPGAIVAPSAEVSYGSMVGPGAVVNSGAKVGEQSFIHSGAVVDYGATLGSFCVVGAKALVGSKAVLADGVFVGPGATLIPGIEAGQNSSIGAGSLVIEPVPAKATVFGVPAKKM